MARKTLSVTITEDGRDNGKLFLLTELPASRAESWAYRAILALIAGGVEVPEGFENMGMAGMAEIGVRALGGLKWEVAEPLLAEMWDCVKFIPEPSKPQIVRQLFEEDIEEIQTRIKLRSEVFKLHTDFLKAVASSTLAKRKAAAVSDAS